MTDKLKVGLLDMLTLLLPGGLLIYTLAKKGPLAPYLSPFNSMFTGKAIPWPQVALFLAAAYVAGHFVYLLASQLDDWIYENVRKVFWNDHRLAAYILERKSSVTGIHDREVINGFKWSCAWLLKNAPTQYAEVERILAESKFFRSLVIVFFISFLLVALTPKWPLALLLLILSFLSLIRYLTQRQKSIDAAYTYMITDLSDGKPFPSHPDREKLFDLRRKSISWLASSKSASPYETNKYNRNISSLKWYVKKVFEVVKLCAFPFYRFNIMPEGNPDSKTFECRWFMQKDPAKFKEWLLHHSGTTRMYEERKDVYYSKKGMGEMSIKDRGNTNDFEIKRQLPYCEDVPISAKLSASFDAWYKWNIAQDDTGRFEELLKKGTYQHDVISKKRWSGNITRTDFQAEYTIVELEDGKVWYSIAFELPYNIKPANAVAGLIPTGIEAVLDISDAELASYPGFLHRRKLPIKPQVSKKRL